MSKEETISLGSGALGLSGVEGSITGLKPGFRVILGLLLPTAELGLLGEMEELLGLLVDLDSLASLLASKRLFKGLMPEVCLGMSMAGVADEALEGPVVLWISGSEESKSGLTKWPGLCLGASASSRSGLAKMSMPGLLTSEAGWIADEDGVNLLCWAWVGWILGMRMFLVAVE